MNKTERREKGSSSMQMSDFIETVRSAYKIDRALQEVAGVQLIGSGDARMACCPFHEDKNPSLSVNISKGVYLCHSSGCEAHGDVFSLLQSVFSMDFKESLLYAANACGISIPEEFQDKKKSKKAVRRKSIIAPRDEIGSVPEGLTEPELVSPGKNAVMPRAGQSIEVFRPDRPDGKNIVKYYPQMVHVYRDIQDNPLMVVLRCFMKIEDHPEGGKKFFIPIKAAPLPGISMKRILNQDSEKGDLSWVLGSVPETSFRPVYGIHKLSRITDPVRLLLVEGEKTTDATERLLETCEKAPLVISPMGGGASVLRMHWAPMMDLIRAGKISELAIWPDADKPLVRPNGDVVDRQKKFSSKIIRGLYEAMKAADIPYDCLKVSVVKPPEGRESGWDLADAEEEGWSGQDVLDWITHNSIDSDTLDEEIMKEIKMSLSKKTSSNIIRMSDQETHADDLDAFQDIDSVISDLERGVSPQIEALSSGSSALGVPSEPVTEAGPDIHDDESDDRLIDEDSGVYVILDNPYFRPLGFNNGSDYFLSLESGYIYALNAQMMRSNFFLKLARKDWWKKYFGKVVRKKGKDESDSDVISVDWEAASDAMIAASHETGVWDPSRERGQGATMDEGRVVFNTGNMLYIEGLGQVPIRDFRGRNCYTIGTSTSIPAFHNPFTAMDPSILKLFEIISSLKWKKETRELSILGLFGWICVSPITGIMTWRPHLWLSGPRSSGKSWVLRNLVASCLGDYAYYIKSNSTEPGIRRGLHAKSLPLIFDEVEGDSRADRERIDSIIRMARHAASDDNSVVLQASTSGTADVRNYRIRSSFLFSSITTQLDFSADKTRFAHACLDAGHDLNEFVSLVQIPAMDLLTPEFSQRFIARMIMRAPDMQETHRIMIEALAYGNLERRIIDVYSSFVAGAWLMLKDGVPANKYEALNFISDFFNIDTQIRSFNDDVSEEKDHTRLFRVIQAHHVRVETSNMGPRNISIGQLISIASNIPDDDLLVSRKEAIKHLKEIGIRTARTDLSQRAESVFEYISGDTDGPEAEVVANCVIIHRKSPLIEALLKDTPYVKGYSQVMLQSSDTYVGRPVRFSPTLGMSRAIVVPLSAFSIGEDHEG